MAQPVRSGQARGQGLGCLSFTFASYLATKHCSARQEKDEQDRHFVRMGKGRKQFILDFVRLGAMHLKPRIWNCGQIVLVDF